MAPKTRRSTRTTAAAAPPKPPQAPKVIDMPKAKPVVTPAVVSAPPPTVRFAEPEDEAPRKKRRTLRDAEQELSASRQALQEAKRKLITTVRNQIETLRASGGKRDVVVNVHQARENAKMKVLLLKYIDKDDSLLCTSQLSMASQQEPLNSATSGSGRAASADNYDSTQSTSLEESENSENSLWTTATDFPTDGDEDEDEDGDGDGDGDDDEDKLMLGPVSQLSQLSQWSEFSSTSNLDEIITFLEKQDAAENERAVSLESEVKELQAQKTNVRVGVGVILTSARHPGCVLIGRRKGSHGAGKFALPGGHLEMYETWEECAIREVKEETDLDLSGVTFAYVTNDPMEDEGKHYITIFVQAAVDTRQTPRNMEPTKCAGWSWEPWQRLRESDNMFLPLYHITRSAFTPAFE